MLVLFTIKVVHRNLQQEKVQVKDHIHISKAIKEQLVVKNTMIISIKILRQKKIFISFTQVSIRKKIKASIQKKWVKIIEEPNLIKIVIFMVPNQVKMEINNKSDKQIKKVI